MNKYNQKFIQDFVERHAGLNLTEKSQKNDYVFARTLYYYLCREYMKASLQMIGRSLANDEHNGWDHVTVRHSLLNNVEVAKKRYPSILETFEPDCLDRGLELEVLDKEQLLNRERIKLQLALQEERDKRKSQKEELDYYRNWALHWGCTRYELKG